MRGWSAEKCPSLQRLAAALVLCCHALLAGCAREDGRVLSPSAIYDLPDSSAVTLAVDSLGRFWLGGATGLRVAAPDSLEQAEARWVAAGGRVIGWLPEQVYLRDGDTVRVAAAQLDTVHSVRGGFGGAPLVIDARGRALFQGAVSGAVIAHHPTTLDPVGAWPSLALPTTALALSPEGDRVYQAVEAERGGQLLVRDLQTGRQLYELDLDAPLRALVADERGVLYGLTRRGGGASVIALHPRHGAVTPLWSRDLPADAEEVDAVEPRLAVKAGRVAVWGLGPEIGLRLLSAADGELLGRTRRDPLDVAFDPRGDLWALLPGALHRLE